MAHLGTGGSWNGPTNDVMRFTLPAVATTTQAITVTPSTGRVGEDVTLSTRVSANHGTNTPTGTVRFVVDGQTRTASVVNGVATTTASFSTAGSKSVTATFVPSNTNQWTGSSRTGTVNIRTEATQTNLALDPVEVLAGATVQASASVNPAGAEGEIEFSAGGEPVRVPVDADGSASVELPADSTGEMTVTATFIPADPQRYTSSSDSQTVDVYEQTSTSTEVTVDADPVQAGQETTLTATITPETAAGEVVFIIDGQTYPATVSGGTATLEHTFLAAGEHVVVADFTPANTERYTSSTGQSTVNVETETTHTALTLDPIEVTAGGDVTATAQITPADADGRVRFDYGEQTQTVTVAEGRASTTFTAQSAGTDTVTATFLPANPDRFSGSTGTRTVEIDAEATQTGLTLDPTEVIEGDTVRASARVTPVGAEGEIEFMTGETSVRAPVGADGIATTDFEAATAGEMTVIATFIPTDPGRYSGSSDSQTVSVLEQIDTSTSLTVDADPARVDEPTTLTATITPTGTAGTVTFTIGGQTFPATVSGGIATLEHTFLAAGEHVVVADFSPSDTDRYLTSSDQVTVNVESEATQTALTLDPIEVTAGGVISATAQITPAGANGQVRFDYGEQTQTAPVTAGEATATFTAPSAGAGTVTATFLPANPARYTGSSDSQTVDVTAETTRTALSLDPLEVTAGGTVLASATVTPAGAAGTVEFTAGEDTVSVPVGADGTASAELPAEAAGLLTVTATFVPASPERYTESTESQSVNVQAEATRTAVTVGTDPARPGEATTLTATVTPARAAGTVTFTIDGQTYPAQVTDGIATLDHTFATVGDHVVDATFTPTDTGRYTGSTGQMTVHVETETTQVGVTVGADPVRVGEETTLTATVTPAGAVGAVTFRFDDDDNADDGLGGDENGGSGNEFTVDVIDGSATLTHTFPAAGDIVVVATFSPTDTDRYAPGTGRTTVTVEGEAVAEDTSVSLDAPDAEAGEEITLTAEVTPTDAEGAIRFTIDGEDHLVPLVDGVATLTHVAGGRGSYTVRAQFIPADPDAHSPSEATEILTVVDDGDPGTDPGTDDPTTGSLAFVGLVASLAIGASSSGSLGSLGS